MLGLILDIMREYGWFVGLFLFVVFLLIKFIITHYPKWVSEQKEKHQLDEEINLNNEQILKHHPFFSNAQYRFQIEIPGLKLIPEKPTRERMFKDLLQISFRTVYEMATTLANHPDLENWSSEEWIDTVTQAINKIIIDTQEKARKENIPEVVIQKFLKWHVESIESLHEYVLLLGNSKLYNTNVSKTNTLLLIMHLLLVTILGDAERVLGEINGEITGLIYKGMTIE